MNELLVQRLSASEPECLKRIRIAALTDAPDAFGTTLAEVEQLSLQEWKQQLEDLPTFVASLGGTDVGIVRCAPHEVDPDSAYLISMWVAPEFRGRGIGDRLVDEVISWVTTSGFSRVVLDVGDDNLPAIALYARKGFHPNGVTSTLPPPRGHMTEHQRVLELTANVPTR